MSKYKATFDRLHFHNRWKQEKYLRNDNWIIFGIYKRWFGIEDFCYQVGLFGITITIWFERKFEKNK